MLKLKGVTGPAHPVVAGQPCRMRVEKTCPTAHTWYMGVPPAPAYLVLQRPVLVQRQLGRAHSSCLGWHQGISPTQHALDGCKKRHRGMGHSGHGTDPPSWSTPLPHGSWTLLEGVSQGTRPCATHPMPQGGQDWQQWKTPPLPQKPHLLCGSPAPSPGAPVSPWKPCPLTPRVQGCLLASPRHSLSQLLLGAMVPASWHGGRPSLCTAITSCPCPSHCISRADRSLNTSAKSGACVDSKGGWQQCSAEAGDAFAGAEGEGKGVGGAYLLRDVGPYLAHHPALVLDLEPQGNPRELWVEKGSPCGTPPCPCQPPPH